MKWICTAAVLLAGSPAVAQQAFVPYTVSEQEHHALVNALGEIPAKHSWPLIQTLLQLEQRARAAARPAEPEKKPE